MSKNRKNPDNNEMVKCACGCTIPKYLRMSSARGSTCAECYDTMCD